MTPRQIAQLVAAARKARCRAYAPYSKFRVGAALLAADGTIHSGGNVESASYGLTICAERVAVGNAISAGCRQFVAIAIVAPARKVTPCGACRQVLAEFGNCVVLCADSRRPARVQVSQLTELLPGAFKL